MNIGWKQTRNDLKKILKHNLKIQGTSFDVVMWYMGVLIFILANKGPSRLGP